MPQFFPKAVPVYKRLKPSKNQPKQKYYDSDTCYDGARGFDHVILTGRYYPDEDVIISIVNAYLKSKTNLDKKIKIMAETMYWNQTGELIRAFDCKEKILNVISSHDLIVMVFHYHYHHFFLAIDTVNKYIFYHDPMGRSPEQNFANDQFQYRLLIEMLNYFDKNQGYSIEYALFQQQVDGFSCGPLVTQSVLEVLEHYLDNKDLRHIIFPQPRKNLSTLKINLMNIQNTNFMKSGDLIRETMLASQKLYVDFMAENKISESDINLWINYFSLVNLFDKTDWVDANFFGASYKIEFQRIFFDLICQRKWSDYDYEAIMPHIKAALVFVPCSDYHALDFFDDMKPISCSIL